MPELAEVSNIRDWISRRLGTVYISSLHVLSGRYLRCPSLFLKFISDYFMIRSYGKYLWFEAQNSDQVIAVTLAMSGKFTVDANEKYLRVALAIIHSDFNLYFSDKRNFGTIKLTTKEEHLKKLSTIGKDPLKETIDLDWFCGKISHLNWSVSKMLMSQKVIAGCGNYFKSESLYLARISPKRECQSLTLEEIKRLLEAINYIAQQSYLYKGVSMRDYALPDGTKGEFQDHLKVYQKKLDPLGNKVVREITDDKRASWWVPEVQV